VENSLFSTYKCYTNLVPFIDNTQRLQVQEMLNMSLKNWFLKESKF